MKILFWDIDGTLIKTDRAGIHAIKYATYVLFNEIADFDKIPTAGRTDCFLAQKAIQSITKQTASAALTNSLLDKYEELLALELLKHNGCVLPNVKKILADLAASKKYVSLLLTGNTPNAAKIKLQHFDVAKYFNFQHSAFGRTSADRNDIAKQALAAVHKHYPEASLEDILIIGDTPNDISCANSIEVKTLAVATGRYSLEELKDHHPWIVLEHLPSPTEFKKLIS
ncbi:MAG: HAD hydrolase-like protein [Pelosinus sp.]|nr:HAD hydrolase-like protein [Pelosinus sp.]